jgi:hypothetical protein
MQSIQDLPLIQSHSGVNLAEAFEKILLDFGISDKVSAEHICTNEDSQIASRFLVSQQTTHQIMTL